MKERDVFGSTWTVNEMCGCSRWTVPRWSQQSAVSQRRLCLSCLPLNSRVSSDISCTGKLC